MSASSGFDAVNRGYEAWNAGDLEGFIEIIHPDIVWETSGAFPGLGRRYEGHDGVRAFWDDFMGPWESVEIRATEVHELGPDTILLRVLFRARGRGGIEVEQDFAQRYEIRDELLYRMRSYGSWGEGHTAASG